MTYNNNKNQKIYTKIVNNSRLFRYAFSVDRMSLTVNVCMLRLRVPYFAY